MKMEFHPEAIKSFNEKAEELLQELKPVPDRRSSGSSALSDLHLKASITEEDIISLSESTADYFGNETGKFFYHQSVRIGLIQEGYKQLQNLVTELLKNKTLRDTVSSKVLTKEMFSWMTARYKTTISEPLLPYLINQCEKQIEQTEIWIPVASTIVQSAFRIGGITLQPFARQMIDDSEARVIQNNPDEKNRKPILEWLSQLREEFQGYAVATIVVEAEPIRAKEIAFEEAEDALAVLRCFAPANLHPEMVSMTAPSGCHWFRVRRHMLVKDGMIGTDGAEPLDAVQPWYLDDNIVSKIGAAGLDAASQLLLLEKKSSFQAAVLDALILYSKSSLAKEIPDKLIYMLAPVEALLLKNENEPIMQNIRDRLAIFLGKSVPERKEISQTVTDVYSQRSKFLHHGQSIPSSEKELLKKNMYQVWFFFTQVLLNVNRFQTKEQFIQAIENIKYSGGLGV